MTLTKRPARVSFLSFAVPFCPDFFVILKSVVQLYLK